MKIYKQVNAATGLRAEWNYDQPSRSWWFQIKDENGYHLDGDTPEHNFAHSKEEIEEMATKALLEAVGRMTSRCRFVREVEKDVKAGDLVRSYDFEGRTDCYLEGIVRRVGHFAEFQDCVHVEIEATNRVMAGREERLHHAFFYPPANGTPTLFGGVTKCIEKISGGGSPAHNRTAA